MDKQTRDEPLRPVLEEIEHELSMHLTAVSGRDVSEETTDELERLSDTLYTAAREARTAAALRRRIRTIALYRRLSERLMQQPDSEDAPPAA